MAVSAGMDAGDSYPMAEDGRLMVGRGISRPNSSYTRVCWYVRPPGLILKMSGSVLVNGDSCEFVSQNGWPGRFCRLQ